MSEFLQNSPSQYVMEINPTSVGDLREQKAVLAMQATALFVAGDERASDANDNLVTAARTLDVAPTLTYEDLIFSNPLDSSPYVMSVDPTVAEKESLFCRAHLTIERQFDGVIGALIDSRGEEAAEALIRALGGFSAFRQSTLKTSEFTGFRDFFVGLNDHPGASAMFSAAVPIVDLLVDGGPNISPSERSRILTDIERGLYPSHQAPLLKSLILEGGTADISETSRGQLTKLLDGFRKRHIKAVKDYIPGAMEGDTVGSGGVMKVGEYLLSKRRKQDDMQERRI